MIMDALRPFVKRIFKNTIRPFRLKRSMPVNVLNLPGLRVLDFKETDTDYHVRAEPTIVSKLCPHCGRSNETVAHAQKTLFIRDLPSHGKSVAVHLDVPRLRCKPCNKTFTAAVPEVDTARQMTERLAAYSGEAGRRFHRKLDTDSRRSWTVGA